MRAMPALLLIAISGPAAAQLVPPPAPVVDPVASKRCVETPASFGCANGANLVVMARPEDLAAGRPLAPAPGALEAAAIARLMADKVKDLRREGTESAGGGNQ
jgi:hypothetical protein